MVVFKAPNRPSKRRTRLEECHIAHHAFTARIGGGEGEVKNRIRKTGDVSIYSAEGGSAILGIERTNGGASPTLQIL